MQNQANQAKLRSLWRLKVIQGLLPNEKVAMCLKTLIPGKTGVEVKWSRSKGVPAFLNLMHCNQIWTCPVCARRVAFERRAQLLKALAEWKGELFQYHLTMRHNKNQTLAELYRNQVRAHNLLKSGRWYQDYKKYVQLVGDVNSKEVTYGLENGWHPHMHALSVTNSNELDKVGIDKLIRDRWLQCLTKAGAIKDPDEDDYKNCCKVTFREEGEGGKKAIDYPVKWGIEEELTLGTEKQGRSNNWSVWQIVDQYEYYNGDDEEKAKFYKNLYIEFLSVYRGQRQLRYDKGLKKILRLNDEIDLPASSQAFYEGFEDLTSIDWQIYSKIVKKGLLFDLERVFMTGEVEKINKFIYDFLSANW